MLYWMRKSQYPTFRCSHWVNDPLRNDWVNFGVSSKFHRKWVVPRKGAVVISIIPQVALSVEESRTPGLGGWALKFPHLFFFARKDRWEAEDVFFEIMEIAKVLFIANSEICIPLSLSSLSLSLSNETHPDFTRSYDSVGPILFLTAELCNYIRSCTFISSADRI